MKQQLKNQNIDTERVTFPSFEQTMKTCFHKSLKTEILKKDVMK